MADPQISAEERDIVGRLAMMLQLWCMEDDTEPGWPSYEGFIKSILPIIERNTANRIWEEAAKIVGPIEPCGPSDYDKQAFDLRTVMADHIRSRISGY